MVRELEQAFHQSSRSSSATDIVQSSFAEDLNDARPQVVDGVTIRESAADCAIHYGPSSTVLFVSRLCAFLNSVLDERVLVLDYLLGQERPPKLPPGTTDCLRTHQEHLVNLFWPTYGCLMPVIYESGFRKHFEFMWSDRSRKPPPLVHIVLALCIQYGGKFVEDPDKDAASDWYCGRAQASLAEEGPSLSAVQSYIFLTIYLQNISRYNEAYTSLGTGVRLAYTLGLNLHPSLDLSRSDQELRKRIWWGLYVLDTRLSIELGRPFAIDTAHIDLPTGNGMDLVKEQGPIFDNEYICSLDFNLENIKLAMAVRSIHKVFSTSLPLYENPSRLEDSAKHLNGCMEHLTSWAAQVPEELKLKRLNGTPFSNDQTLAEPGEAPIWLQLQRISLELYYHSYASNFQRRFINYIPHGMTTTPLADQNAISAMRHATTVTNIVHRLLGNHDRAIAEWYDIYNIQFNAALTLVAYTIAYPTCAPTPPARKSIIRAIENLERFGISNAGDLVKGLHSKARVLMDRFRTTRHVPAAKEFLSAVDQPLWQGEPSTAPLPDTPSLDVLWPDIDYCDQDMWASFLNELEMEADGTVILQGGGEPFV